MLTVVYIIHTHKFEYTVYIINIFFNCLMDCYNKELQCFKMSKNMYVYVFDKFALSLNTQKK